jgi:hypothetical protein
MAPTAIEITRGFFLPAFHSNLLARLENGIYAQPPVYLTIEGLPSNHFEYCNLTL